MPWLEYHLAYLGAGAGLLLAAWALVWKWCPGRVADVCAALFLAVLVGGVFALDGSDRDMPPPAANNLLADNGGARRPAPGPPASPSAAEWSEPDLREAAEVPTATAAVLTEEPVEQQSPPIQQAVAQAPDANVNRLDDRQPQTVQTLEPPPETLSRAGAPQAELPQKENPAKENPPKENPPKTVNFFKTTSEAESVVYVVDCSSSMGGTRFQRATEELRRSIGKLDTGQSFYASFFNNRPVLMFGEQQARGLVQATPEMVARVNGWLDGVSSGGGTFPERSMQIAASLKPDVIYLLSDGEFAPLQPATMQLLIANEIKVNTIAFESSAGGALLKDISDQTGGVYRFAPARSIGLPIGFASRLSAENEERLRQIVDGAENAWELAHGAGQGPPTLMEEMFNLLLDDDPALRGDVAAVLEHLTGGVTFDLPDTATLAEREEAVRRWRQWYVADSRDGFHGLLKGADRRELGKLLQGMIASPNIHERWGLARYLSRSRNLNVSKLLVLIADEDPDIRAEAKVGLMELSDTDYGPRADANETEREFAGRQWRHWWELHQARKRFENQLNLVEANPQAARDHSRKIASNFPDTPLAQRAEALADHVTAKLAADEPPAEEAPAASEADERDASAKLRVTAKLFRNDPATLRSELKDLIGRYPDTMAAGQAREVLFNDAQRAAVADFRAALERTEAIGEMSAAERSALLVEIIGFAQKYAAFPVMGKFAESAALRLEQAGDFRLAAQAYGEFARILAASGHAENQQLAQRMDKALRRCRLPGNRFDLVGETAAGEPFDWQAYRGKAVVVVFWSVAAPGIAEQFQAWQATIDRIGPDRLAVVAACVDRDTALVEEFLRQYELPGECLVSKVGPQPTANYYGITAAPYFVLVGADATVLRLSADRGAIMHKLQEEFPAAGEPSR